MSDKFIFRLVMVISLVVLALVIILNRRILPAPETPPGFTYSLPMLNALLNGTCAVLLALSLMYIKKKNIAMHKRINITAFFISALFLISYVTYHWLMPETKYPEGASMRGLYYAILISHIILAALVLPLILLSFWHGLKNNVDKHRKLVRFTYPIWMYVCITGPVIYLMISPYYNFPK